MKMKKPDLSRLKVYLFEKGERIGLIVCGALAVLLVGVGIMKVAGSAEPFADDFKKTAQTLDKLTIDRIPEPKPPPDPPTVPVGWKWSLSALGDRHWPFTLQADKEDENKRREPLIFKPLDDEKNLRYEFIPSAYFAYELSKDSVKAFDKGRGPAGEGGSAPVGGAYVKIMRPARMVVVTAVFPWKQQVDEFQRKLQIATLGELQSKPEDMPQPLGLDVYRMEVKPGQELKETDWDYIYRWDPKAEKLEVAERIDRLYREAMYDLDNPAALGIGKHVHPGLVTPLPLLSANQEYKKLDLPGITFDPTAKPKPGQFGGKRTQPAIGIPRKQAPGVAGTAEFKDTAFKDVSPPTLKDQFTGKIDWFKYDGILVANDPQNIQQKGRQFRPAVSADGKGVAVDDAIVRFVDVDVKPGKTYIYDFRVRMANPNFGKHKDVAVSTMAEGKELYSAFARTPYITIPLEYYYYAVNQKPDLDPPIPGGADAKGAKQELNPGLAYGLWETPVQIHRWIPKYTSTDRTDFTIASWAIAERLLTRRGDPIGRHEVMVEVPIWNKSKEAPEIGHQVQKVKNESKRATTGLPLSFIQDGAPPLYLVDFHGGKQTSRTTATKDESAVDILVLTSDGKLTVRNSRHDSDPDTPEGKERLDRYNTWLRHIRELRGDGGGGIAMPNKAN